MGIYVKNRKDLRYRRAEERLNATLDKAVNEGRQLTKVLDLCAEAHIDPCTFYRHYDEMGELLMHHDDNAYTKLDKHLCTKNTNQSLSIVYFKVFQHILQNREYFDAARARSNHKVYKKLMVNLKPLVLKEWNSEHNRNTVYHKQDGTKRKQNLDKYTLDKIYHAYAFDVLREFSLWIEREGYAPETINTHVRNLVYLTETACQRLNHTVYLSRY